MRIAFDMENTLRSVNVVNTADRKEVRKDDVDFFHAW